jgi:hypothetical protein
MNRPGIPLRARMRLPRFRAKNFSTCTRSPTARGSSHASHSPWDDVAFSSTERDRHLGIRPVSQLNTWPVVSPVNASRRPSRDAVHHSGSGRLARPSPWGTFTSYSLPASWRTPRWVKNSPASPESDFRCPPRSGHCSPAAFSLRHGSALCLRRFGLNTSTASCHATISCSNKALRLARAADYWIFRFRGV